MAEIWLEAEAVYVLLYFSPGINDIFAVIRREVLPQGFSIIRIDQGDDGCVNG